MRISFLVLASLILFFGVGSVFAGDAPSLLSPSNNSTVTLSKLEWQTPSYPLYTRGSYYMVQVDDQQTFANPEKNNIYLTNNYYSPQLNPGIWYWRVKAKDANGSWSNWSDAWSFTLGNSTPTPTPTPIPTPSPSPTSTPTTTASPNSFTIFNIPSRINSNQSFKVSISLSSNNQSVYFKGAFKKAGSFNYFGLTKVSGNWVKNSSNYSSQYPGSGNFDLEIMPDVDDSGYTGSDDYLFKIAGYSASGGLSWSNETTINIQNIAESESANSQSISTTDPTPKPTSKSSASISPKKSSQTLSTTKPVNYKIASVAAAATFASSASKSSATEAINSKQFNPFKIIGIILIITGLSIPIFFFVKLKLKSKIP